MPVLDANIRQLRLDEDVNSPIVDVASEVSFIATANVGYEYSSTRTLDRALVDRFSVVEMDVLNKEQEMKLIKIKRPNLSPIMNETICDISEKIKNEASKDDARISSIISTRLLLEMAEMVEDGFKLEETAELIVYPHYSDEGGTDSERIYIRQLVQKYIQQGDKEDLFTDDDLRTLDNFDF